MKTTELVQNASDFVFELFKDKLSKKLVYHTYKHTAEVAATAHELATAYKLADTDTEDLLLAAWFHDTGYIDTYVGHEEKSAERARNYLSNKNHPTERVELVCNLILATRKDQRPHTLAEEILTDADMAGIGTESFFSSAELLRLEWEIFLDKHYSDVEWQQFQLDFLLAHQFHTQIAQERFTPQLQTNIEEQRKHLKKASKKKEKKKEKKQETYAQPKRGVETMFKNIYKMHISLSGIADKKANMMISVNSIILSIVITYTGAKSASSHVDFVMHRSLIVPLAMLLLTTLCSLISSIISSQPEVTSLLKRGQRAKPKKDVNLLFFGNYTKLPLPEFEKGIQDLMRSKDGLYNNMIMDIYYLGEVLTRKYRLLRISYAIFMFGLVITVITFVLLFILKKA